MENKRIAVIVETMNSYGQGIVQGIYRYIRNEQPECTLFYEERTLDSPPPVWLKKWSGDGIIVRDRTGKSCRLALKTGAKVVDLSERRASGVPTVMSDHAACSRLAAEHFLKRGFVNFGFVGLKGRPFSDKRRDAFVKALGTVELFELLDDEYFFTSWGSDYSVLIDWLTALPKPIGIMACYDLPGVSVLQACRIAGINVPDSVAVIGVNNDELQCAMSNPPMSSVIQNQERLGYEACHLLFRLMEGKAAPEKTKIIEPLGIASRRSTDILVIPDQLIVRSIHLIREHACEGITIDALALKLGVARRTLERRFLKATGHNPHQEITAVQMNRACELLTQTTLPIQTIARRVGLNSLPHFTKIFTKTIGKRPTEFRRS